ncbi:hypothetical protein [Citromicrobium sp. WPS32]|uniref:hypothetical protein n=1 Tax=Citromicrobium sp. WPS32 TaxID=1634517 RepID=UPI0006C8ED5E|nr:hypothetical protein [Citromicrobium sp. WPS32]KPM17701.1 hypothetical protein WG75_00015 [Citromicrobium sp. WPS32]
MPEPLEKWQEHLEGHFSALAATRARSGLPIFALEHGLTESELEEIATQLKSRVRSGSRLAPHWLLWAIYSAERGYAYAGGEYWHSFEAATPGWEYADRYKLAGWFKKFQQRYNGVVPSGPWAEQFRIIAWPITHAVLPRYLQRHFAKLLYELRFSLASLTSIDPSNIGRLVATNAHGSARFDEFLQQEELVGRIVLALLHRDPREGEEPLLPSTLDRITTDLERVRNARDWLRETGRVVSDRFRGIASGSSPRPGSPCQSDGGQSDQQTRPPDIKPRLLLRFVGDDAWSLMLDVPSFKSLATLDADILQFLRRTRCTLNGSDGKRPAGWVLSGNRRAVLQSWPDPERPLVSFEQTHGVVDHLVASDCRMTPGPIWLFRIGRDGVAREIAGRVVRPGSDYIIASREVPSSLANHMTPCRIDCEGIRGWRLSVPNTVPTDLAGCLTEQGLELARTIRVWPAGLPGRNWDGEGHSEWLTTEEPCIAILPDHAVKTYIISLDDKSSTAIAVDPHGGPTFLRLPQLEPGHHILTVRAERIANSPEDVTASSQEGHLELTVREPEPWIAGTTSYAGMVATADPHDAGLDVFWENQFNLSVLGPLHRTVSASVVLEDADGDVLLSDVVDSALELPITPQVWRKRFQEFLDRKGCAWSYLAASAGILKLGGQELGELNLRFEHEAQPLRWVLRHDLNRLAVRLVDDTGQEDGQLKCRMIPLQKPLSVSRVEASNALREVQVDHPGGLFIARSGNHQDTIMISAGLTAAGLGGLGVTPRFENLRANPRSIIRALRIAAYWRNARLAGFLAHARRQQVVEGLMFAIVGALCGDRWVAAEMSFLSNSDRSQVVNQLKYAVGQSGGFTAVLFRDAVLHAGSFEELASWYADLAQRYDVCGDAQVVKFALSLASQPHLIIRQFRDGLEGNFAELIKNPVLVRGARTAALFAAVKLSGRPAMHPEWRQ